MSKHVEISDIRTPLIAQEIWLLEHYVEPSYCARVVQAWTQMIVVAEAAYDDYMRHIPSNYRQREISEQVDIVWGNRVLPNFRSSLNYLQTAYARILQGDLALHGFGVYSDIRGSSDYWHQWMADPGLVERMGFNPLQEFCRQQYIAQFQSQNVHVTLSGYRWKKGDLQGNLGSEDRGYGITLPQEWPTYRLNPLVQCETGERTPRTGIYLPAVANSCAQLLVHTPAKTEGYLGSVPTANIGSRHEPKPVIAEEPTIWTLVERVSDTGGGKVEVRIIDKSEPDQAVPAYSASPGQPCPRSGLWQTPALVKPRSVRREQGQPMPSQQTDHQGNVVVWFWREA